MSVALVGLAIVVVAGGVVAVSSRGARIAIAGLTAAAAGAPLLVSYEPVSPVVLSLAARLVAALLAGYLLWIAVRGSGETRGSSAGWPADALLACAGAVAGGATFDPASGAGSREAAMAGFALAALSIGPLLVGRDALRVGLGVLLAVLAAGLVRVGLVGAHSSAEQLGMAGLTVALGVAAAAVVAGSIRTTGALLLGAARLPAAHRPAQPRPSQREARPASATTTKKWKSPGRAK